MSNRIPRKDEKERLKIYYDCMNKGCKWVEGLIITKFHGFYEENYERVRCTKSNFILNKNSKICPLFEK